MIIQGLVNTNLLLSYVMGQLYGVTAYGWSEVFRCSQMDSTMKSMRDSVGRLDFDKLTAEEAIALGFQKFGGDEDNEYLVPVWMIDMLPKGTVLTSIMGRKVTVGTDDIDDDHRGGLSAYSMDFKPSGAGQIDFVPRLDDEGE